MTIQFDSRRQRFARFTVTACALTRRIQVFGAGCNRCIYAKSGRTFRIRDSRHALFRNSLIFDADNRVRYEPRAKQLAAMIAQDFADAIAMIEQAQFRLFQRIPLADIRLRR